MENVRLDRLWTVKENVDNDLTSDSWLSAGASIVARGLGRSDVDIDHCKKKISTSQLTKVGKRRMHTLRLSPVSFTLHSWQRLGYPPEQLLHVVANFGTSLDEHKSILLGFLFALRRRNFALVVQIRLVAHQDNDDIVSPLSPDIVHPLPRVLE